MLHLLRQSILRSSSAHPQHARTTSALPA